MQCEQSASAIVLCISSLGNIRITVEYIVKVIAHKQLLDIVPLHLVSSLLFLLSLNI
jgi:hypothetical protein